MNFIAIWYLATQSMLMSQKSRRNVGYKMNMLFMIVKCTLQVKKCDDPKLSRVKNHDKICNVKG